MKRYLFKRIFLMVPTFFLITMVVFVLIQMIPGRPDFLGNLSRESAVGSLDSYLLYKQQFHLDKPILLNTRFFNFRFLFWQVGVSPQEVKELLEQSYEKETPVALKNGAREILEDYSSAILSHLCHIIATNPGTELQKYAVFQFLKNARRPLVAFSGGTDEEARILNREIEDENRRLETMQFSWTMNSEQILVLSARVVSYYAEIRDRFDFSFVDKLQILFLDTRFARYVRNLLRLDFGLSFVDMQPVMPKILSRLKYSMILSFLSVLLTYLIALPIGVYCALHPQKKAERVLSVALFVLYSLPTFFVGSLLLFFFSQGGGFLKIFPTGGFHRMDAQEMTFFFRLIDFVFHLILPVLCMTYVSLASLSRYARSGMMDVFSSEYIKVARAKGLDEWSVILRHGLRNGMIPVLTLLGSVLPAIVSGSVVIEVIFNLPGIGFESYQAVLLRDYNMVMGIQLISAMMTLIGLFVSDFLYAMADPRIVYEP